MQQTIDYLADLNLQFSQELLDLNLRRSDEIDYADCERQLDLTKKEIAKYDRLGLVPFLIASPMSFMLAGSVVPIFAYVNHAILKNTMPDASTTESALTNAAVIASSVLGLRSASVKLNDYFSKQIDFLKQDQQSLEKMLASKPAVVNSETSVDYLGDFRYGSD